MNFDALSIAAMATELRTNLLDGRVQRVVQLNSLTYGFEIYVHPTRHNLILSAEPQAPRLHLSDQKVRRGAGRETPLLLVLRKYLDGARLRAIIQPPYERLLHFQFDSLVGQTILVLEMLGTHSNLLLLEADQTILGVARLPKFPQNKTAKPARLLMPNHLYHPPSPQHKLDPTLLNKPILQQELTEASPNFALTQLLPQIISGVSPLLAREMVYRATGDIHTTVADIDPNGLDSLLTVCRQLFDHDQWQPTLATAEDGQAIAFAPYPLQHLPHTETTATFSLAVQTYFAEMAGGYAVAKEPLLEVIKETRQKLTRRREQLHKDAEARSNPTMLKQKGEAILAYTYQIKRGQTELVAEWLLNEPPLKISLKPTLSPSENAAEYFHEYRKALRAADEIPAQVEKVALEENYLDQLEQDLHMADNRAEIDAVAEALAEAGYVRSTRPPKKQPKTTSGYLRLTAPEGATVWVGKNALQNAHLTFQRASPDDLWFHAQHVPGSHVIIPTAQGLPSDDDVLWAASIAAYYSRAREETSADVAVVLKKYVRPIKGAAPGLVTYRHETILRVAPQEPIIEEE